VFLRSSKDFRGKKHFSTFSAFCILKKHDFLRRFESEKYCFPKIKYFEKTEVWFTKKAIATRKNACTVKI